MTLTGDEAEDRERMHRRRRADRLRARYPAAVRRTTAVRAALMTVRPYGRVVLMGGVGMLGGAGLELPYPWIMRNCIAISRPCGCFRPRPPPGLVGLVRSGVLRPDHFAVTEFALDHANEAVAHAAANGGPFRSEAPVLRPDRTL